LLPAIFTPEPCAVIGQVEEQHFIECIACRQGAVASAGNAESATSTPATNLANRLIPVPP